jgi:hypothetical protein
MAPEERLAELLDQLMRETLAASTAREAHQRLRAMRHHKATMRLLEQTRAALEEVDNQTRAEHEPELQRIIAASALVEANLYAGNRSLAHNSTVYKAAIALTDGLPSDFEGRARSAYGAVLMFFKEWEVAAQELQRARQCLHTPGFLAHWALTTCRLATTYWQIGRTPDAMRILRELTSTLVAYQSKHLTVHHLNAVILLSRLLWRRGQFRKAMSVADQATAKLRSQRVLLDSQEYAVLMSFTRIGGVLRYEIREACTRRRSLDL